MAFDTAEKRRSAIHLTKRGALPVPKALIDRASRLHFIGIFSNSGTLTPSTAFNWRNKNRLSTLWEERIAPPDSSTQEI